jgi:ATP/ADP translocase
MIDRVCDFTERLGMRTLAWFLAIFTPVVYLILVLMFFTMKVLDWHGADWGDVFLTPCEPIKDIWSYAWTGK